MKKFLKTILFLCALSSIVYAEDDGMAVLNKKRAEIEKAEKAKAKLEKEAAEKAKKEAEEQAKVQAVETVEAPAEIAPTTEGMSEQDEKEAMDILEGMRKKIKTEDAQTLKLQKEAKELGITTSEAASLAEIEAMVKAKKAEQAKPKTEAEKLEATRKEALEKLDEIMNDEPKATETAEPTEAPVVEEAAAPVEETVQ